MWLRRREPVAEFQASPFAQSRFTLAALLQRRHGEDTLAAWRQRREQTRAGAAAYDQRALQGELGILYRFGEALIDEHELAIDQQQIRVPGFAQPIQFSANPGYADLSQG